MEIKGKGLVLHQIKHKDSRIIVQVFTPENGKIAFVTSVGGKSRPRSLFQPATLVNLNYRYRDNKNLQTISSIELQEGGLSDWPDIARSSVALFMAEVLHKVLPPSYPNLALFRDVEELIRDLISSPVIYMIPIRFVITLINDLGFEVDTPPTYNFEIFDVHTGEFKSSHHRPEHPESSDHMLYQVLDSLKHDGALADLPSQGQRKYVLQQLMSYLRHQLDIRQEFKSHEVLELVLNS